MESNPKLAPTMDINLPNLELSHYRHDVLVCGNVV